MTRWSAHCVREAPLECCGILCGIAPRVSLFYPLRNDMKSETRYNADPHDLIAAHIDFRRQRGRDPGDLSFASALAGRSQPDRSGREPLRARAPDHRVASAVIRPTSGSGGSTPTRFLRARPGESSSRRRLIRTDDRLRLQSAASAGALLNCRSFFLIPNLETTLSSMQRTLIIFKPDCVQRRLVGSILERFEAKGLRIAALKLIRVDRAIAEKHYAEHHGKPFFEGLIEFITSSPVVVGVLVGNEAITVVRGMLGATNGAAAAPGTDPRRLLDQQAEQPDARQRQSRVGPARDRALVSPRGAGRIRARRRANGSLGGS